MQLKDAEEIAYSIICTSDAWCERIEVVGSIRRRKSEVHDIDFIVLALDENWRKQKDTMTSLFNVNVILNGDEIFRVVMPSGIQADFYRAKPETYGIHKLVRTGSAEHNIFMAKLAIKKGMRLQYSKGLVRNGEVIAGENEEDVFRLLGLPYIEPELREIINGKPAWSGKI